MGAQQIKEVKAEGVCGHVWSSGAEFALILTPIAASNLVQIVVATSWVVTDHKRSSKMPKLAPKTTKHSHTAGGSLTK